MKQTKTSQFDLSEFIKNKPEGIELIRLRKNTPIFLQGDKGTDLFLVEKGRVKLTAVSSRGKQAVVAVLKEGDFLGEECLSGKVARLTTATAISECSLVRMPEGALERLILREPSFVRFLVQGLVLRCLRGQQDLINSLFISVEKRLAQVLLALARLENTHDIEGVELKISQQELAEMTGATRTRVNQLMNKFRKRGLIDYSDVITIHTSLHRVATQE